MIRAVLDTNTLASAAVASSGPLSALLEAWRTGQVQVEVSPHILRELETTLNKSYFTKRLDAEARERFLTLARLNTTTVTIITPVPNIAKTLADNLVLATAENARADYLVTGDAELLGIRRHKATRILSSREFVRVLEIEAGQSK